MRMRMRTWRWSRRRCRRSPIFGECNPIDRVSARDVSAEGKLSLFHRVILARAPKHLFFINGR